MPSCLAACCPSTSGRVGPLGTPQSLCLACRAKQSTASPHLMLDAPLGFHNRRHGRHGPPAPPNGPRLLLAGAGLKNQPPVAAGRTPSAAGVGHANRRGTRSLVLKGCPRAPPPRPPHSQARTVEGRQLAQARANLFGTFIYTGLLLANKTAWPALPSQGASGACWGRLGRPERSTWSFGLAVCDGRCSGPGWRA